MKLSEYRDQRRKLWQLSGNTNWIDQKIHEDAAAAEAAGVTWDPEDVMPERLALRTGDVVFQDGRGTWVVARATPRGAAPANPEHVLAEMVRRYNEWGNVDENPFEEDV